MEKNKSKMISKSRRSNYGRRVILEIVKQVEEGVSRSELVQKYGLGKSSISTWMRKYGSDCYHRNKRMSFPKVQIRKIAVAVRSGKMSIREALSAYQIRSAGLVRAWIKELELESGNFSVLTSAKMTKSKKKHRKKRSVSEIEKALEEAQLKIAALNTMIDVAEQELKIDIRKKAGAKRSLPRYFHFFCLQTVWQDPARVLRPFVA